MARYINLDEVIKHLQFDCKAKYPLSFSNGISAAISEINRLPTADVVPKSEVDNLEYTLMGVMHSVDKWLEGEEAGAGRSEPSHHDARKDLANYRKRKDRGCEGDFCGD